MYWKQMSNIDVKFLTDSKRISACRELKNWTLEQLSNSLKNIVTPRSTQLICSEDTKLKPPLIHVLASVLEKPEYQFLAEIPKTYIFFGDRISDERAFSNIISNNHIIDIRWGEAMIEDNSSFEHLLSCIDDTSQKTGPLILEDKAQTKKELSFKEKFKSFETNREAYSNFLINNSMSVDVWVIPVFKVFKTYKGVSDNVQFVWKSGVIIEFFRSQKKEREAGARIDFPTFASSVGEEEHFVNNKYCGYEPELEKLALDSRPDLIVDGNINFGSLEIDKILRDRSAATVTRTTQRVITNKNSDENKKS